MMPKARLWVKLLANPDDLTDLRIIFAEYTNTKAQLEDARSTPHSGPPIKHRFATFEERQTYLKAMQDAQQWRAREAALEETCASLREQLHMMADLLNPEDLEDFLSAFDRQEGNHASL